MLNFSKSFSKNKNELKNRNKESVFVCPKCRHMFVRDNHYRAFLDMQNNINLMMGGNGIKDLCPDCSYFKEK